MLPGATGHRRKCRACGLPRFRTRYITDTVLGQKWESLSWHLTRRGKQSVGNLASGGYSEEAAGGKGDYCTARNDATLGFYGCGAGDAVSGVSGDAGRGSPQNARITVESAEGTQNVSAAGLSSAISAAIRRTRRFALAAPPP